MKRMPPSCPPTPPEAITDYADGVYTVVFNFMTLQLRLFYVIIVYRIAERREHAKQLLKYIVTDDMKVHVVLSSGWL